MTTPTELADTCYLIDRKQISAAVYQYRLTAVSTKSRSMALTYIVNRDSSDGFHNVATSESLDEALQTLQRYITMDRTK